MCGIEDSIDTQTTLCTSILVDTCYTPSVGATAMPVIGVVSTLLVYDQDELPKAYRLEMS